MPCKGSVTLCTAHYLTGIRTTTDKFVGGLIDSHKETHINLQKAAKTEICENVFNIELK